MFAYIWSFGLTFQRSCENLTKAMLIKCVLGLFVYNRMETCYIVWILNKCYVSENSNKKTEFQSNYVSGWSFLKTYQGGLRMSKITIVCISNNAL